MRLAASSTYRNGDKLVGKGQPGLVVAEQRAALGGALVPLCDQLHDVSNTCIRPSHHRAEDGSAVAMRAVGPHGRRNRDQIVTEVHERVDQLPVVQAERAGRVLALRRV